MEPLSAEDAVSAVRAVLEAQGAVGGASWRTDVSAADGGAWTVRT